jgi:hypothetical protein
MPVGVQDQGDLDQALGGDLRLTQATAFPTAVGLRGVVAQALGEDLRLTRVTAFPTEAGFDVANQWQGLGIFYVLIYGTPRQYILF